jgi:hypothetical protein
MSRYPDYPLIWTPPENDSFFTVKVPATATSLPLKNYLELMKQCLEWMMSQDSADDAQTYLRRTLHRICPAQQTPIPDQEDWKSEWAMTIVHYTESFYNRNEIHPEVFPATPIDSQHLDYQNLLDNHNETSLNDWLSNLQRRMS